MIKELICSIALQKTEHMKYFPLDEHVCSNWETLFALFVLLVKGDDLKVI